MDRPVEAGGDARVFRFIGFDTVEPRWFERGQLEVLTGPAAGLTGLIKRDRFATNGIRSVELWQSFGIEPRVGDMVRLIAGCDKRVETCRLKFDNFLNFRGFPDIPGEEWLTSVPVPRNVNDGGSRR